MKILNVAICSLLLFSIQSSRSEDYDWNRLTTTTGKVYNKIQLLDADKHGLLFRHSRGIAKENFTVLSYAIRDNFQVAEEVPEKVDEPAAGGQAANVGAEDLVLTLTIRQRITTPQPYLNPCYRAAYHHPYHPNPVTWPRHWQRFHNAHYLTNPHYRALATRNFLYDSGLIYPYGRMPCRY